MMFTLELSRRLAAKGSPVRVTAAHPGYTATDLQRTSGVARFFNPLLAMKAPDGALPTLRAAVDPAAAPGSYWGPSGLLEMRGPPDLATVSRRAQDKAAAARLFDVSERLTGMSLANGEQAPLRAAS
jgi:NAD(P)-dependent dehydrogenase (short-subunit alcohol dehydrogenase family)